MISLLGIVLGVFWIRLAAQPAPLSDMTRWQEAVRNHQPGTFSIETNEIAKWQWERLEPVLRRAMQVDEPVRLLRAGSMYLDIAIYLPPDQRARYPTEGSAFFADDGRWTGDSGLDSHIWWARALVRGALDHEGVEPRQRELALAWFRTTTAFFASISRLADMEPNVAAALKDFPHDAGVQFDAGCMQEAKASPIIQAAFRHRIEAQRRLRVGPSLSAPDAGGLLNLAERHYRRSIELDPSLVEARVRLGRVLVERGRHAEAVRELEPPVATNADSFVRYHALMSLGEALYHTNNPRSALDAFRRAALLFPEAPSPHIAMSRLHAARGDISAARAALVKTLSARPDGPDSTADPWWNYGQCAGRDFPRIFRAFVEQARQTVTSK